MNPISLSSMNERQKMFFHTVNGVKLGANDNFLDNELTSDDFIDETAQQIAKKLKALNHNKTSAINLLRSFGIVNQLMMSQLNTILPSAPSEGPSTQYPFKFVMEPEQGLPNGYVEIAKASLTAVIASITPEEIATLNSNAQFRVQNQVVHIYIGNPNKVLSILNKKFGRSYNMKGKDAVTIMLANEDKTGTLVYILLDPRKLGGKSLAPWIAALNHEITGHIPTQIRNAYPRDRGEEELAAFSISVVTLLRVIKSLEEKLDLSLSKYSSFKRALDKALKNEHDYFQFFQR